jgi:hypothetical protein
MQIFQSAFQFYAFENVMVDSATRENGEIDIWCIPNMTGDDQTQIILSENQDMPYCSTRKRLTLVKLKDTIIGTKHGELNGSYGQLWLDKLMMNEIHNFFRHLLRSYG